MSLNPRKGIEASRLLRERACLERTVEDRKNTTTDWTAAFPKLSRMMPKPT